MYEHERQRVQERSKPTCLRSDMQVAHGGAILLINAEADPRVCAATCKWPREGPSCSLTNEFVHGCTNTSDSECRSVADPRVCAATCKWPMEVPSCSLTIHQIPKNPQMRAFGYLVEPADKPGSVVDNHSSGTGVTTGLLQPTRRHRGSRFSLPIWSCFRWGLPSHRVLPLVRCALTAPFHPYLRPPVKVGRRYIFCCTFRRLTPPRNYLAPCPAKPGLSSPQNQRIYSAVAWPAPGPIFLQ